MDRGAGIAGNGMVLRNGQTTKRDSIALEEGGGVIYSQGVTSPSGPGLCPKSF
jgi:hypothetical protein